MYDMDEIEEAIGSVCVVQLSKANMLRWIRKFRLCTLLSDLKSKPSPFCPPKATTNVRFDSKDNRLPNALSATAFRFLLIPHAFPKPKPSQPSCPCRIRLANESDTHDIVQFVRQNVLHHEPLLRSLNVHEISAAELALLEYIRQVLRDSFTLLALGTGPMAGRIVGLAVSRRSCSWDGKRLIERADRTRCDQLRKLLYIWSIVESEPDLHQHFCTRCLFEIALLATAIESQRQGIGFHLALHSLQLARDLGFRFARMNCTCDYSSRIATKAGLKCHWTVAYHHLVDSTKQPVVHPDPPHTHIKVHAMALFVPSHPSSPTTAPLTIAGCPLNPHAGN
uniref:N-acetyltransferase domain-containing protein n=1 Tax=Anopheles culicifacies TaxID=139723 RepID=A0A182M096_9DIPT